MGLSARLWSRRCKDSIWHVARGQGRSRARAGAIHGTRPKLQEQATATAPRVLTSASPQESHTSIINNNMSCQTS